MSEETKQEQQEAKEENSEVVEEVFAEEPQVEETAEEQVSDELSQLEEKLNESENRYLRLRADFDNFRRRVNVENEAKEKYRAQGLITELLPALDNFERALNIEADNEQTKQLLQGMEMVHRSLVDALKKEGVEPIEAVGQEFDPHLHQAVMQVEDENFDSNVVVEEFQKGYKLKDRVIRPSMVKVSQ
ncbi:MULTISPECIES: nucleotide exchange factor GrpE [Bacillaceae]|uniref:nucleotide exchange factor GrpE n=1 Tax=Bacillaceae TaxID=186817 RepID=UPI001C57FAE4|nr:nucleotide exchange factor GrpE [Rossellomorea sp. YZS02]MBW3113052.1 nucleotide exchange factor GrpE [Bacillus sp. MCCB 382]MDX8341898.1 nucleotide exchange factor GrpE [Rossellomorea sp. YZS02]